MEASGERDKIEITGLNITTLADTNPLSTTTPSCWMTDYVYANADSISRTMADAWEPRIYEARNNTLIDIQIDNPPTSLTADEGRVAVTTCFSKKHDLTYPEFGDKGFTIYWRSTETANEVPEMLDFKWVKASSDLGDWVVDTDDNIWAMVDATYTSATEWHITISGAEAP